MIVRGAGDYHRGATGAIGELSHSYVRFVIAFALSLLVLGVLVTFGFTAFIRTIIDHQVALRVGGQSFGWWSRPPVEPIIRIFVYNVTNADEFLNNGTKPILDELGPYVYV
ncbi:epithelial membrane protein [Anopheles darlingi]|uniref:Scavenger receptor class B member 1 n=1 Tax=Anopheles darlingi TaxID=43151 RepID=W5JQ48_ANODA|nr:epithelial membrane protein [Anopheles darlingi]